MSNLTYQDRLVSIFAILQRISARMMGTRREFGANLAPRASHYLSALSSSTRQLRFLVALRNVCQDTDLLDEEAALVPECLNLQLRLLDIAEENKLVFKTIKSEIARPPIAKLFVAILKEAVSAKVDKIQIHFSNHEKAHVQIFHFGEVVMIIPPNISRPLRGYVIRMEQAGYRKILPLLAKADSLPSEVAFHWPSPAVLEMRLTIASTES